MATQANDGTADGLVAFLDYLIERGYGSPGAVTPLKSAVKQVLAKVEDSDDYGDVDIREMDVNGYLDRFATLGKADYKQESIAAYRKRFERAANYYRAFLTDGSVPRFTGRASRAKAENGSPSTGSAKGSAPPAGRPPSSTPASTTAQGPALVDYPFPLRNGQLAFVRLPKTFEKTDAERMSAFLLALAFDGPPESPAGAPSDD